MMRVRTMIVVPAVALCVALSGCATRPRPTVDTEQVERFAGRGYASEQRFVGASQPLPASETPPLAPALLTVPIGQGPFPLVIWLPGLGQGEAAGSLWRDAWVAAGYAVLSLQPLAEDAGAWSSPRARSGDFQGLGRERFAARATVQRIAALSARLGVLLERGSVEAPIWSQVDTRRVAIAGFEIGAHTAAVLAGEALRGATVPTLPIRVQAIVCLSPFADFSGEGLSTRFAGLRTPALFVTSELDDDPLGLVTATSLRTAPYRQSPAGGKHLLVLRNAAHAELGGNPASLEADTGRTSSSSSSDGRGDGDGARGRGRRGGGGGMSMSDLVGDRGTARELPSAATLTQRAMHQAAIASASVAFFDATLRGDAIAAEWLARNAPGWIGPIGRWASR